MTTQLRMLIGVALFATLALAGALGVFTFGSVLPVGAQGTPTPSASRSFSPMQVAPGGAITVTITTMNAGSIAQVVEMLPSGFTYVRSSLNDANVDSTNLSAPSFSLFDAPATFTYVVLASMTEGTHSFSGVLQISNDRADDVTLGGADTVTVGTGANGGNGGTEPMGPESARLTTDKASSATRLTITGSGSQLGEVGPNEEIVISLDKFGLPSSIAEADVTIDDGSHTTNPQSVSVSGSNITLLLGKFDADLPNDNPSNEINASDVEITIIIRDRAGITTPVKAGKYTVKVDAKDLSDDGDTYDLDGAKMMVSIIRSISVSPKSAVRGTEITVTGKGFSDGSAGVMAGDVSIGSADIADGSFTLTVNNNIKVNNVSAFAKGADGTGIQATDGAGDPAAAAANHKIKATFTADPESPNPGQDVTITLADTDVTGSSTVSVKFGGGDALGATNTDDDKDTTWKVGVPSSVRRGTIQMSVKVGDADALTKNITIATNPLEVTPSTVVPGQVISVTGSGFKGASTIDAGGVVIGSIAANTAELLVNNVGSVTFDVSVPDGIAAGDTKVVVTDAAGRVGEAKITVTKAALTLDPDESLVGSDIMVSGVGFPANDLVLIKYNGNTITTSNTDSTGTFSKGIGVPSSGIATGGSYSVTAESQINDVSVSASKTHKTPKPAVTLSNASAIPGSSITLDGANFKGFVQVYRIEIGGQNVTTLPAPATDQWGSFSATVQVPQLSPGRYAVKAIVEDTGGDSATEFLQVVEAVEAPASTDPAEVFADLISAGSLSRVWYLDPQSQTWSFYDPDPAFAAFNELTAVTSGETYILIITAEDTFGTKTLYPGTQFVTIP